jgi:hypothetical protein
MPHACAAERIEPMHILEQAPPSWPQALGAWLARVMAAAVRQRDAAIMVACGGRSMAWAPVRIPVPARRRIVR